MREMVGVPAGRAVSLLAHNQEDESADLEQLLHLEQDRTK
jgi:hypothetical protein